MNLAPHVSLTTTADGAMLLDEHTGRMFHLNESGHTALRALLASGTDRAADELRVRYGIDSEHAWRDVRTLISDLTARGLLTGGVSA